MAELQLNQSYLYESRVIGYFINRMEFIGEKDYIKRILGIYGISERPGRVFSINNEWGIRFDRCKIDNITTVRRYSLQKYKGDNRYKKTSQYFTEYEVLGFMFNTREYCQRIKTLLLDLFNNSGAHPSIANFCLHEKRVIGFPEASDVQGDTIMICANNYRRLFSNKWISRLRNFNRNYNLENDFTNIDARVADQVYTCVFNEFLPDTLHLSNFEYGFGNNYTINLLEVQITHGQLMRALNNLGVFPDINSINKQLVDKFVELLQN
ncbi:hypothetical protein E24_00227 [Faustovirus]|nr:hypothetical protein PRJ_Fausto_00213 [Faustovirus]AMN83155.1 hypothetical protein E24_00227 [Faustovirus]AMN84135.1 hypothetical protein D5a_00225 [Faustovirus]AMN85124.1 hypothetical protein E23_00226 [Faustovirus]QBR99120.1 hypothetical protein [Faustovirus mariensis]